MRLPSLTGPFKSLVFQDYPGPPGQNLILPSRTGDQLSDFEFPDLVAFGQLRRNSIASFYSDRLGLLSSSSFARGYEPTANATFKTL